MIRIAASLITLFCSVNALASAESNLAPIGPHVRLFTFEKNENSQNIMVVYGKVDHDCHFVLADGKPMTDFYWLMGGKTYKPVNSMIKSNIRQRIEVSRSRLPITGATDSFEVVMSDLKSINPKLGNLNIDVSSKKSKAGCDIATDVMTGKPAKPSLHLDSVYSESEKTLLPPFRKLVSLTLKGTNAETGLKESRVVAKRQ